MPNYVQIFSIFRKTMIKLFILGIQENILGEEIKMIFYWKIYDILRRECINKCECARLCYRRKNWEEKSCEDPNIPLAFATITKIN